MGSTEMTDEDITSEEREAYERHKEKLAHNRNPDNEMSWHMKQAAEYGATKRAEALGRLAVERLSDETDTFHANGEEMTEEQIRELGVLIDDRAADLSQDEAEQLIEDAEDKFEDPGERLSYKVYREREIRLQKVPTATLEELGTKVVESDASV